MEEKNNIDEQSDEEKKEARRLRDKEIDADIAAEIEESLERRFGGGDRHNAWWEDRALPVKIVMGFGFGVLAIGFGALAVPVVMKLWNWLMPEIFGLTTLTYWKAGGLLLLTSILFKNCNVGNKESKNERRRKRELKRYINEEPVQTGE